MTVDRLTLYEETSFWSRDLGQYSPRPSLEEPIQVDVAIVGGGFLGLNTARELMQSDPGARVAVLEGAVVGYGASGRNAGFSMTLFGLEPQVTRRRWGRQRTLDACRYMIRAVDYTKQIIEDHGLASDYSHPGFLRVAYTRPQVEALEGAQRIYRELGVADELGLQWLERDQLRSEFESPLFAAGLSEAHCGLLNPCKHVRELKRLAVEAGAEVYERTPVQSIERQGQVVVLTTPGGTVRADRVVLATNAYTHLLEGVRGTRSLQLPVWTSVIVTEPLSEAQWARVGWTRRQGVEDVRQLIHYFRPTADGRILIGGQDVRAPRRAWKDMDHDSTPRVWRGLERHLRRLFPGLQDVAVAYRWAGPVSVNFDLTPEIGFLGDERILYSTGCLGHGVSLTHLNGRLIADLLSGKETELTSFWIVNRSALRVPGRWLPFLGAQAARGLLRVVDRVQSRGMPS
jgi:glycine/D-amino acid oxidase-like deaminating enzyme